MSAGEIEERKKQCERRELYIRAILVTLPPLYEALWLALALFGGFQTSGLLEILKLVTAGALGLVLLLIFERFLGIGTVELLLFSHQGMSPFRGGIRNLVSGHKEVDDVGRAVLTLNLMLARGRHIEENMDLSFEDYLYLLTAAAGNYTHDSWFATYRLELAKWSWIRKTYWFYFDQLKESSARHKTRVALLPQRDLDKLSYESGIVVDTVRTGATLHAVELTSDLVDVPDYAIFDDELVIKAWQSHPLEMWDVAILRGKPKIGKYSAEQDELLQRVRGSSCRTFTPSGYEQFVSSSGITG